MIDALVIGAGPNGLVAANVLADAGWDVVVLEAQPEPGGAVKSAELTLPGFRHDVFSSFYPVGVASPAIAALRLEEHGLCWRRHPLALAHPSRDGSCAALSQQLDETAASLEAFAAGDGDAWRALYGLWERVGEHVVGALFTPFPPLRASAALLRALGPRGLERFMRFGLLPVRRLGEEEFGGDGGRRLLAGSALHASLGPELPGGALYGWVLCGLGQQHGFPIPEGGAGALTQALVRRLTSRGGQLVCGAEVNQIVIRRRRAVAVRTRDGHELTARRAILAAVDAPRLLLDLVGAQHLPARLLDSLARFQRDNATFKVDWALDGPIPWRSPLRPARQRFTLATVSTR